jgi:hypothetical protein
LRTPFLTNSERSHECERGTQECVRYKAPSSPLVTIDCHGTDSLTVAAR